jgi:hypothetical protein
MWEVCSKSKRHAKELVQVALAPLRSEGRQFPRWNDQSLTRIDVAVKVSIARLLDWVMARLTRPEDSLKCGSCWLPKSVMRPSAIAE